MWASKLMPLQNFCLATNIMFQYDVKSILIHTVFLDLCGYKTLCFEYLHTKSLHFHPIIQVLALLLHSRSWGCWRLLLHICDDEDILRWRWGYTMAKIRLVRKYAIWDTRIKSALLIRHIQNIISFLFHEIFFFSDKTHNLSSSRTTISTKLELSISQTYHTESHLFGTGMLTKIQEVCRETISTQLPNHVITTWQTAPWVWKLNTYFGKSMMCNSETQNIHFLHWIHKTLERMYIFCSRVNIGTICTPLNPLTDEVNGNNCSNKMMRLVKMPRPRDSRWCSLTPNDLQNIFDASSTLPSVAKSNFNIEFV